MATAVGSIALAGCCKKSCLEHKSTVKSDMDFSRIAYCCIDCDTCPLYKATINEDNEAKMKVAKEWGEAEKPNFKLENFYCYGCKDERSCGMPGRGCTVRKCAVKKGFATCAQCADFEECEEKLWQSFPQIRDKVRRFKKELGLT
jgi:hypothetical protein